MHTELSVSNIYLMIKFNSCVQYLYFLQATEIYIHPVKLTGMSIE